MQANASRRVAVGDRRRPAVEQRRGRSRRWAPARRRCAARSPRAARGIPGGLDARHPVGLRAGPGGEPLGHLELDHDEHPLERREGLEEVQHDRAPRRCRAGSRRGRSAAGRAARRTCIASAWTTSSRSACAGASRLDGAGQGRREGRVHLDGGDVADLGQQGEGQRAEARADLDDRVVRAHPGERARSAARCWRRRRSSGPTAWSAAGRGGPRARGSARPRGARSLCSTMAPTLGAAHDESRHSATGLRWPNTSFRWSVGAVRREGQAACAQPHGPRPGLGVVAVGDGDLLGARREVGARGEVVATVGQPRGEIANCRPP